jgi:hypothetical protein
MSKNHACLVPVLGASGSGKSEFLRRLAVKKKIGRLLVWNPMQQKTPYPYPVVSKLGELTDQVLRQKRFNLVFDPGHWDFDLLRRQFNQFCELALEAEDLTLIVEELKHVARAQYAPRHWLRVTGDGRQYGLRVFGTSQRPVQIDKDFLGNATLIRTGRLVYQDDIDTVAKYMRIDRERLEVLQPLDWIEKNLETGDEAHGKIAF